MPWKMRARLMKMKLLQLPLTQAATAYWLDGTCICREELHPDSSKQSRLLLMTLKTAIAAADWHWHCYRSHSICCNRRWEHCPSMGSTLSYYPKHSQSMKAWTCRMSSLEGQHELNSRMISIEVGYHTLWCCAQYSDTSYNSNLMMYNEGYPYFALPLVYTTLPSYIISHWL